MVRKGRLKVLGFDGTPRGYVENVTYGGGVYDALVPSPDHALLVSFSILSADELFEIQILVKFLMCLFFLVAPPLMMCSRTALSPSRTPPNVRAVAIYLQLFGIIPPETNGWMTSRGETFPEPKPSDAYCIRHSVAECCSMSAKSGRGWAMEQKIWKVSENWELSAEYPRPDGSRSLFSEKLGKDLANYVSRC